MRRNGKKRNTSGRRNTIIVLGMHRSGTSAITRGLKALGIELGSNLMPPGNGNERGYWEDFEIFALNEALLATLECSWHSVRLFESSELTGSRLAALRLRAVELLEKKFGTGNVFGFKDPRLCRLLPFWQQVFGQLGVNDQYVIALRNPLSVAQSLATRDGFSAEKSYLLWLEHVIPAIEQTERKPRVLVDFDILLNDPIREMKKVASVLGIPRIESSNRELRDYAKTFLSNDLRHAHFKPGDLAVDPRLPELAADTYTYLYGFAKNKVTHRSVIHNKEWKRIAQNFGALAPVYELVDREAKAVVERDGQIARLNETLAESSTKIGGLNQAVTERDAQVASLNQRLLERDGQIAILNRTLVERDGQIARLSETLAESSTKIGGLNQAVTEHDARIASLNQRLLERDGQIASINQALSDRDAQITRLNRALVARDEQIASLNRTLVERGGQLANFAQVIAEHEARGSELAALSRRHALLQQEYETKQQQLVARDTELATLRQHCEQLQAAYAMVLNSRSWRMTAVLRTISARLRRFR